jgi:hypothetical protein
MHRRHTRTASPRTKQESVYRIIVAPEPNESRPLFRWRLWGSQLVATGIALTEAEALRQARLAAEGSAAA